MKNFVIILALGLCSALGAEKPAVEFAGVKYQLVWVHVAKDGSITNEYVPMNQTIESWTTLLAIRQWPKTGSLRGVVADWLMMIKPLLVRDVAAFPANGAGNAYDQIVEAWISAPDRSYIEINLHRFLKEKGTDGIKAYQFAQKIRMTAGKGDPAPFLSQRDALFSALAKLALPAYKTPDVLKAELVVAEQELADLRTRYKDGYPAIRSRLKTIAEIKKQLGSEEPNPTGSVPRGR